MTSLTSYFESRDSLVFSPLKPLSKPLLERDAASVGCVDGKQLDRPIEPTFKYIELYE